jgi:hypothetical protein
MIIAADHSCHSAEFRRTDAGQAAVASTVTADLHHILDQTLDCLFFAQFSFKAFAEGIDDGLSERLASALSRSVPTGLHLGP